MMKILYVVAVIIGFASTAYAISCNVCDATNADCGDPFKSGKTFATACYTIVYPAYIEEASGCLKLKIESSGKVYTSRSCYYGDASNPKEICKRNGELPGSLKLLTCDICTTDLCNSSTSTGIFAATVMFLVVLVRMLS